MHRLALPDCGRVLPRYLDEAAFFPLIAAVLEGRQDGTVHVDDLGNPRQAYVEHAFGFAQTFGEANAVFEAALAAYLTGRRFPVQKVRLYTPLVPECLLAPAFEGMRSERQRYMLAAPSVATPSGATSPAAMADVAEIDARFGIVTRFWRNAEDFIRASHAQVVRHAGRIAAVCYAAATGDGRAEVDVVTDLAFRRQGLGRQAVAGFISACARAGLEPVWDCFTNNLPSVRTALSLGFIPKGSPYAFFTIQRA